LVLFFLDELSAGQVAGNFVALASCGFYDGLVFHRTASLPDGTPFVIQGGDPAGDGSGGPGYTIQDERVTTTYHRGTVAMARTADPDSQGSQFFIVMDDKAATALADANTYAIFGSVVDGMAVADQIYQASPGSDNVPSPIPMTKVTVANPRDHRHRPRLDRDRALHQRRAQGRKELRRPGEEGLLRRRRLPSRHPGLRRPGG
jgi:cyclophilin family peptidyl-prolyl cis-trans isomerase